MPVQALNPCNMNRNLSFPTEPVRQEHSRTLCCNWLLNKTQKESSSAYPPFPSEEHDDDDDRDGDVPMLMMVMIVMVMFLC